MIGENPQPHLLGEIQPHLSVLDEISPLCCNEIQPLRSVIGEIERITVSANLESVEVRH